MILVSRSSLFSSRKFKMAGIDWWSFLFYYFFPSNFFIPFFWHIRACLSSFACQQRPENIFSLNNNFSAMLFTLGNDFIFHVNIRDQPRKNIFNKNNIFDCKKRKIKRLKEKRALFISLRFLKCSGRNFPREWKFIKIIETNWIESKWIRILNSSTSTVHSFFGD